MEETKEILFAIKHQLEIMNASFIRLEDQQNHMYKEIHSTNEKVDTLTEISTTIKNEQQHIKRDVRSINRSITGMTDSLDNTIDRVEVIENRLNS